jgi:hypothetical protein
LAKQGKESKRNMPIWYRKMEDWFEKMLNQLGVL